METNETLVVMDTTLGKIKFKLYNDTPQHRDNFIKLAKAGQYDGDHRGAKSVRYAA